MLGGSAAAMCRIAVIYKVARKRDAPRFFYVKVLVRILFLKIVVKAV
jgi:hypothetical protein